MATIQYASVLPGTGKTHAACKLMLKHLDSKDGVLLYSAPTHKLLRQVKQELEEVNPKYSKFIYLVDSKELKYSQVATRIKSLLDGSRDTLGWKSKKAPPGSIVLCTHPAFALLPHESDGGIKSRNDVKVIFDEARNCILSTFSGNLPIAALQYMLDNCITLYSDAGTPKPDRYVPFSVQQTKLESLSRELAKHKVKRGVISELINCLSSTQLSATRMYCSLSIRDGGKKLPAAFQIIQVPHRLFHGWKKVLLLSAFFETSQMYHFLKISESLERGEAESKREFKSRHANHVALYGESTLVNVSDRLISKQRQSAIEKRFAKTYITYLSPDSALSKLSFDSGVMVASDLGDFNKTEFVEKFKKLALKDKSNKNSSMDITFGRAVDLLLQKTNGLLDEEAMTATERNLLKHVSTYPGLLVNTTPLQWYTRIATRLSEAWYRRFKMEPKPLLATCNVGDGRYEASIEKYIKRGQIKNLPFVNQGLNTYQQYHTVAFLAATNPKPITKKFLNQTLPDYDVELDFTLNQCAQTVTRCSVRNTESTASPLIIVPTKKLALALADLLGNKPKVINPQKIYKFPFKSVATISGLSGRKVKGSEQKVSTTLRGFYTRDFSKTYEEFNRLSVWMHRNKKRKDKTSEVALKTPQFKKLRDAFHKERTDLSVEFEKKLLSGDIKIPESKEALAYWRTRHKNIGKAIWEAGNGTVNKAKKAKGKK